MIPNPDYKGLPLFDIDYFRHDIWLLQTTNVKHTVCDLLNFAITNNLNKLQGYFSYFCLKISVAYFSSL